MSIARRSLLVLAIAAIVAGCATPEESGPVDRHQDGDRDGIPDNESPVEGANEPNDNATMPGQNLTALNETLP